ncbi:hypothetical protein [Streptomyces sp. NPDC002520]
MDLEDAGRHARYMIRDRDGPDTLLEDSFRGLPPVEYLVNTLPAGRIADRYKAGENARELSAAFGCSRATIYKEGSRNTPKTCRRPPAVVI